MSAYVFDQAWEAERARVAGLELGLDQGTIRHFESLGVGAGWHYLDFSTLADQEHFSGEGQNRPAPVVTDDGPESSSAAGPQSNSRASWASCSSS